MFPRILIVLILASYLAIGSAHGQKALEATPRTPAGPDLVELSLGYNYIHLDEAAPETKNLHGVDFSAFVNVTSWLGLGGDFMADFGSRDQQITFSRSVTIDSQRYVYVFGPRVTVWQNPSFRVFVEALGGGVHAKAELSLGSLSQHASEDARLRWPSAEGLIGTSPIICPGGLSKQITCPQILATNGKITFAPLLRSFIRLAESKLA